MYLSKKIACVIPARLASTRFPKKVLSYLGGVPLLQRVYQAAVGCEIFDEVVIAVDDMETQKLVATFNANAVMTSPHRKNGTERLLEAKAKYGLHADVFVNWQADEPFIKKQMIEILLQTCYEKEDIWTLRKKINEEKELHDPNIVKVVVDQHKRALYFSRAPIPFVRDAHQGIQFYKHIGLYAYTSEALDQIQDLSSCFIEEAESLEQLRFLYHGLSIKVHETEYESLGIDLPEHLELAEKHFSASAGYSNF